jgi:hypothetical protein
MEKVKVIITDNSDSSVLETTIVIADRKEEGWSAQKLAAEVLEHIQRRFEYEDD